MSVRANQEWEVERNIEKKKLAHLIAVKNHQFVLREIGEAAEEKEDEQEKEEEEQQQQLNKQQPQRQQ